MEDQDFNSIVNHFKITEKELSQAQEIHISKNCDLMREKMGMNYMLEEFGAGKKESKGKFRIIIDYDPDYAKFVSRIIKV